MINTQIGQNKNDQLVFSSWSFLFKSILEESQLN